MLKLVLIVSTLGFLPIFIAQDARLGKFLGVLNVVRFKNGPCPSSTSRNGTCYTVNECTDRGGKASGECASGFGVCCVFSVDCGATTSENCTYLSGSDVTAQGDCSYKVCRCNSDICRLRFDFITHSLTGPGTFSIENDDDRNEAAGDCLTDTFSITTNGNMGSPVICGINTGQHMIVDPGVDGCATADFVLGSGGSARNWEIKVTQYECNDPDGGPEDCLQYLTGTSGTIASFNYPIGASSLGLANQHLSNQNYHICLRRESGYCGVCFSPTIVSTTAQASFGLSDANEVRRGMNCQEDYLQIPGLEEATQTGNPATDVAFNVNTVSGAVTSARVCGAIFALTKTATTADTYDVAGMMTRSVCTRSVPFRIAFHTDSREDGTREADGVPNGIVGFSLDYRQVQCV